MIENPVDILIPLMNQLSGREDLFEQSTIEDELPNLKGYWKRLENRKHLEKQLRFLGYHLSLVQPNLDGLQMLDAGSGLGVSSIIFSVLTGVPAVGVEKSEHLYKIADEIVQMTPGPFRPTLHHADVTALPLEDASMDIITCFEALSHFRHPWSSLEEMVRVCKPGGSVLVSDANNAANPRIRDRTLGYWKHFEQGPSNAYTPDRYHYITTCYEDLRTKIIEDSFPDLPADEQRRLARETFGLNAEEVKSAVQQWQQTGAFAPQVFDQTRVPVDPLKDDVRENLFDPFELCTWFKKHGLTARVYPYFGAARNRVTRIGNQLVRNLVPPSFSLRYSKLFILVATKPKTNNPS